MNIIKSNKKKRKTVRDKGKIVNIIIRKKKNEKEEKNGNTIKCRY